MDFELGNQKKIVLTFWNIWTVSLVLQWVKKSIVLDSLAAEMGSSKRKSSFRIDDILHQQAEQQQMLFHHQQQLQSNVLKQLSEASHSASSSTPSSTSTEYYNAQSKSPSESPVPIPSGPTSPKKPTALYPNLMDLQKSNFPLHLQFGMPAFNPALNPAALNAAYLEHYANVLQKGKFVILQTYTMKKKTYY